jgi:hypothetical protein
MADESAEPEAFIRGITGSAHGWEMWVRLGQSVELTDALWELVPVVVAAGQAHDQMTAVEVADRSEAGLRLDSASRAAALAASENFMTVMDSAFPEALDESKIAALDEAEVVADPYGTLGALIDMPTFTGAVLPTTAALADLSPDQFFYLRAHTQATVKTERTSMLLTALFVTAVGFLEPLVTRLVRLLLFRAEGSDYASLADPRLDRDCRERCYGVGKWRAVLVEEFNVSTLDDLVDWDRVEALWEDRNVLVHRGGVTDSRHSSKTGSVAGTVLSLDASKVQAAIDEVGAARFGLVAGVWQHLSPGMGWAAAGIAGALCLDSLRSGRWRQAEGVTRVQAAFAQDGEAAANARVNRWLARDMGLGPENILSEVETWPVGDLPPEYELARHILLRHDDDAVVLLGRLVTDGTIRARDVSSWPLFDRLRQEGKLTQLEP